MPKPQMDVVAETLTAQGFDVRGPDWEESRLLKVMGLRDTTCEITVEDSGFVTCEYRPAQVMASIHRLPSTSMAAHAGANGNLCDYRK